MINSSALFSVTTDNPSWTLSPEAVTVRRTDEMSICPLSNGGQHQLTPNTSSSIQSCPNRQIILEHCTRGRIKFTVWAIGNIQKRKYGGHTNVFKEQEKLQSDQSLFFWWNIKFQLEMHHIMDLKWVANLCTCI